MTGIDNLLGSSGKREGEKNNKQTIAVARPFRLYDISREECFSYLCFKSV